MKNALPYCLTLVLPERNASVLKNMFDDFSVSENINVLSKDKAIDVMLSLDDPQDFLTSLDTFCKSENIKADYCLQPTINRKKTLLICDMDSTLIGQECIVELADFAGVKGRVHEITELAMRGEIDFDGALRERVGLLKGLPLSVLQECYEERIVLNPGADTLAKTMSAHGAKTVIVSGGFTFFTERVAKAAGFDTTQANILLDNGTHLSGDVADPILGRAAKQTALEKHAKSLGGPENAVAIGDGANDLAMIETAGLGIAFYAKPIVAAQADCAINHTDLTTALHFQGYREDQFVS